MLVNDYASSQCQLDRACDLCLKWLCEYPEKPRLATNAFPSKLHSSVNDAALLICQHTSSCMNRHMVVAMDTFRSFEEFSSDLWS